MLAQTVEQAQPSKYNLTLLTIEKARRLKVTHTGIYFFILKQKASFATLQSSP